MTYGNTILLALVWWTPKSTFNESTEPQVNRRKCHVAFIHHAARRLRYRSGSNEPFFNSWRRMVIADARVHALQHENSLPDFVCTQTTRRFKLSADNWQPIDVIVERLTYFDHREVYKVLTLDGQPANIAHERLNGTSSSGEFGSLMKAIFLPETETEFEWHDSAMLRGKTMQVYAYRVRALSPNITSRFRNVTTLWPAITASSSGRRPIAPCLDSSPTGRRQIPMWLASGCSTVCCHAASSVAMPMSPSVVIAPAIRMAVTSIRMPRTISIVKPLGVISRMVRGCLLLGKCSTPAQCMPLEQGQELQVS